MEEKIINNKNINETYGLLNDFFHNNYSINSFELLIKDKSKVKKELLFSVKHGSLSKSSLLLTYTLNNEVDISFNLFYNDKISVKEIENTSEILKNLTLFLSNMVYTVYLNDTIKKLKLIDYTTGLYNRKYLVQHLEKMLPLAKREKHVIGFLSIGIDRFKAVIEEFSYDVGEDVLIKLAHLLVKEVRTSDIVIHLEADEFLIVLPNVDNINNAGLIAEKLVDKFSKIEFLLEDDAILKKTICAGVTLYPNDSATIEDILKNSDLSLLEARNTGRSKVFLYSKESSSSLELF